MAHIQHHSRHISDSSLLVSCLRHSGVLPAAPVNQVRHSSLPASYATSPVIGESVLLAEAKQEDYPAITLTVPPQEDTAIEAEVVLGKGKEKWHNANNANGAGLTVVPITRRQSFRSRGQGNQHGCLHEAIQIGSGVSLAGPEGSGFGNASISTINILSSGPRITHSYRPFTPPIRPRTSSLTGTQLRSISEGLIISPDSTLSTPSSTRLGVSRNFSTSSEPTLSPSVQTSKMTRPCHSPHRSLGLKEDFDQLTRLYHPKHSTDSSLLCLNLSTAEKRTISKGIEQDEARAEERAEERRKTINVRRFAGMVRTGSDCPDGEQVVGTALTPGRCRGRKWENMFNQNDSGEGRWPIRDEPLDPVEVQAMGMLVPLMEMNPNEPGKDGDDIASPSKTPLAKENLESSEHMGLTGTVKRRITMAGAKVLKQPSLIFRITGSHVIPQETLTEAQIPQEVSVLCSQESPKEPKSLRHKISSTLLRYIGHMRSLESTDLGSPTETASSSESGMTADASLVSLSEAHAIRKSKSKLWRRRHRGERRVHSPSTVHSTGDVIKILHPLNEHYESASRRRVAIVEQETHNYAMLNLLLGLIRKRRSDVLVPLEGEQVEESVASADGEGKWNGYGWESVKFREAGKNMFPAIGEGELALDRDFYSPGKTLRKVKESYTSLRPRDGGFTILPQKANISWTNFLHEFAGTLGNVRESGVRPISDNYRGSADSLLLEATAARQSSSLGRSMLSHSADCLMTTEMEEYEREEGDYSCLGSTDGSESEDGMEKELIKEESVQAEDEGMNVGGGENEDSAGEGEPACGYSLSSDEGSSVDDDEDSKLRALLHRVGRPYAGYSSGGDAMRYNSRDQGGKEQEATFASSHHNGKSNDTAGNDSKTLGNLSQNYENIRNGGLTIQEDGIATAKSTFVGRDISGNEIMELKEGGNENTKPREIAEDYSEYTLEDHIPGFGFPDGQWGIEPEVMRFLVH
ncbi:hypothetical protein EV426DRAFT_615873 [Tirmania nivea]|nr:hypothetical protein EV426DRAFT_615873 [Tirmania nivea]